MKPHSVALSFALLPLLPAQHPTFIPNKAPMIEVRADRIDELVKQLAASRAGRMFADPDVAPAVAAAIEDGRRKVARRSALVAAATSSDIVLEPWLVSNLLGTRGFGFYEMFRRPIDELRSRRMLVLSGDDDNPSSMATVVCESCGPRFEGRWTQQFEAEAALLRGAQQLSEREGVKFGGLPVYAFSLRDGNQTEPGFQQFDTDIWMLHLPGTFVHGSGDPSAIGSLDVEPPPAHPGLALRIDLEAYLGMIMRFAGAPPEIQALGLDKLHTLEWRGRIHADRILDELEVSIEGEPSGLLDVLLSGDATLPRQALPDTAIAQLRAAISLESAFELMAAIDEAAPAEMREAVEKALDGGIAIACCAPPPGGVVPNVLVTLGLRDEQQARDTISTLLTLFGLPDAKQVDYGGVPCAVLTIPGAPQGLQPTWCIHDGQLHLAESARSMRAFLAAQRDGIVAMDVGDAPTPEATGERLENFDLRWHEARLYASFRDVWLPLYELAMAGSAKSPLQRADLPDPDVIAEYCSGSRAVITRRDNSFVLQSLGTLGGPELAALAMIWGPMLANASTDFVTEQLAQSIATHKLRKVGKALKAFRDREQRWPKDLAELFTAERLAPDALLVPGDDLAETLHLADGSEARTSFRYFPTPVGYQTHNGIENMLLIEIRPSDRHRAVLDTNGNCPDVWSPDADKPIDQFGKETGSASSSTAVEVTETEEHNHGGGK